MGNQQNGTKKPGQVWAPTWVRGVLALVCGAALYEGAMRLLGVQLEYFEGIGSFNLSWVVAMSIVPVVVGVAVGMIYGYGGKYLAHLPPAAVMVWHYQHVVPADIPLNAHLLPWGMWVMFVILQMEFCAVGGFIGEVLVRKHISWDSDVLPHADSEPLPEDDAEVDSGRSL